MSPVKTAYIPRFGSQPGSSQRDEPQPGPSKTVGRRDKLSSRCRKEKRANKRAPQSPLKVKLPQFSISKLPTKKLTKDDHKTPAGRMLESAASKARTPVTPVTAVAGAGGDSTGKLAVVANQS